MRWVLLPRSTYTRPPLAFTLLLVALVSGNARASSAAFSTLSLAYSRLALEGVRTWTAIISPSVLGRKSERPKKICRVSATARLRTAMMAIHVR